MRSDFWLFEVLAFIISVLLFLADSVTEGWLLGIVWAIVMFSILNLLYWQAVGRKK